MHLVTENSYSSTYGGTTALWPIAENRSYFSENAGKRQHGQKQPSARCSSTLVDRRPGRAHDLDGGHRTGGKQIVDDNLKVNQSANGPLDLNQRDHFSLNAGKRQHLQEQPSASGPSNSSQMLPLDTSQGGNSIPGRTGQISEKRRADLWPLPITSEDQTIVEHPPSEGSDTDLVTALFGSLGDEPCSWCEKVCGDMKQWLYHLIADHTPTASQDCKSIACPLCSDEFGNRNDFFNHCCAVHNDLISNFEVSETGALDNWNQEKQGWQQSGSPSLQADPEDRPSSERKGSHQKGAASSGMNATVVRPNVMPSSSVPEENETLVPNAKKAKNGPFMCDNGNRCPTCSKIFKKKRYLKVHYDAVHLGKKPFVCSVCGKRCAYKGDWRRHMKVHKKNAKKGPVPEAHCEKCKRVFANYVEGINHFSNVHEEIRCPICGNMFSAKSTLMRHCQTLHYGMNSPSCPLCGKILKSDDALVQHMRTHWGNDLSGAHTEDTKCAICSKNCGSWSKRIVHHANEHKVVGCPICGILLSTVRNAVCHFWRVHLFPKRLCKFCGKSFVLQKHLETHQNTSECKDYAHPCECCTRRFKTVGHLRTHVRAVDEQRSHQCSTFNAFFSDGVKLNTHQYLMHGIKQPS